MAGADSAHPTVGQQQFVDDGVFADLGARLPRGLDEQGVEHFTSRAVQGPGPVHLRIPTGNDDPVDVEPDVGDRWRARRLQAIEQPPAAQPGRSGRLQLMAGQRVARKVRPIEASPRRTGV